MELTVKQVIKVIEFNMSTVGLNADTANKVVFAKEMAIRSLLENEYLREAKRHLNEYIDEASARHTEMQDNIAKLLEENEKLKEELKIAQWGNRQLVTGDKDLTAAEVLEWLKNNYENNGVMLGTFGLYYLSELLDLLTPQEIIERITEYKKSKSDEEIDKAVNTQIESISSPTNINFSDIIENKPVSNSDEFQVGDYVKIISGVNKGFSSTIKTINYKQGRCSLDGGWQFVNISEIEHAEPAKEEHFRDDTKMIEWVYELYYRPHATDYFLGYCDTEESAIEACEYYTLNENLFGCYYKKVCRRKEQSC